MEHAVWLIQLQRLVGLRAHYLNSVSLTRNPFSVSSRRKVEAKFLEISWLAEGWERTGRDAQLIRLGINEDCEIKRETNRAPK